MRVAIYTRLSPTYTKDDTTNQERDLIEYVKVRGWELTEIYRDIYVSGTKRGSDRAAFTKLMQAASERKFDLLLFWSLDRLTREGIKETLQYLDDLAKWGVEYKSLKDPLIDSDGPMKKSEEHTSELQ